MDSTGIDLYPVSETLQLILTKIRPQPLADTVALGLVGIFIFAYLLQGTAWDRPDPYKWIYFERPQQPAGAERSLRHGTRDIAEKAAEADKRVVVLWGSQSGTAERLAHQLASECQLRFGLPSMAVDLSDYEPASLRSLPDSKLAVFILSTYGDGDPSDNARNFWEFVNDSKGVELPSLHYAAFGLGNSQYRSYNRVVDVVVESLNKHGAKLFLPVGKADDAKGATEEDFMSWKSGLFQSFTRDLHVTERPAMYEPNIAVVEDESFDPIDLHHGEPSHPKDNLKAAAACSRIRALAIRDSRNLFSTAERDCVHLELDLTEFPELHYKTGDHLAVWPTNPDEEVHIILSALSLYERREIPISLQSLDPLVKLKVPTPTTASALFRFYLGVSAPLSRNTVLSLAQFAPTPEARSYLLDLSKDKNTFAEYIARTHLTFGRLLSLASPTVPWSSLPLPYVIEALPKMQPRYYSISSSSVISPRRPTITALVSAEPLCNDSAQKIYGLTSNYLLALSRSFTKASYPSPKTDKIGVTYDLSGPTNLLAGTRLFAHIRKSKFKLPILSSTPVIMVAAGTGFAPFRAFLAERAKLKLVGKPIGETLLFFGCRHPDQDFIYRDEIENAQEVLGKSLSVITAFSRVEGQEKIYVQTRVREFGEDVSRLLMQGSASFYICGRASMARNVGRELVATAQTSRGWNESEASSWAEGLKKKGKWQEDVWG